jgi:hypothetical protein
MDDVQHALSELSELLGRYGHDERVSFIGTVIDPVPTEAFWHSVAGPEFWGGSGAVWEVEPFHLSHPDVETSAEDYRRFQILMVELADRLEAKGLSDLASRRASLFRAQLRAGS